MQCNAPLVGPGSGLMIQSCQKECRSFKHQKWGITVDIKQERGEFQGSNVKRESSMSSRIYAGMGTSFCCIKHYQIFVIFMGIISLANDTIFHVLVLEVSRKISTKLVTLSTFVLQDSIIEITYSYLVLYYLLLLDNGLLQMFLINTVNVLYDNPFIQR